MSIVTQKNKGACIAIKDLRQLSKRNKFVNNLSTFPSHDLRADDFMLLLQNSGLESTVVNEMITKVKRSYVLSQLPKYTRQTSIKTGIGKPT